MKAVTLVAHGKVGSGKSLILSICREALRNAGYWVSDELEGCKRTKIIVKK
jgi:hypothetical protein